MATTQPTQQVIDRCITECLDCVDLASRCANQCIGDAQMAQCARLCLDCVTLTAACAELLARSSPFGGPVCHVCADLCDACATECEKYPNDDVMRRCAAACRRCAQTCRQIAAG